MFISIYLCIIVSIYQYNRIYTISTGLTIIYNKSLIAFKKNLYVLTGHRRLEIRSYGSGQILSLDIYYRVYRWHAGNNRSSA